MKFKEIEVLENEVFVKKDGETFIITSEDINNHFKEKYGNDESVILRIGEAELELFNRDLMYLQREIESKGSTISEDIFTVDSM